MNEHNEAAILAAKLLVTDGPGTDERILGIERLAPLGALMELVASQCYSKNHKIRAAAAFEIGRYEKCNWDRVEELTADRQAKVRRKACLSLRNCDGSQELLWSIAERVGEVDSVRTGAIDSLARLAGPNDADQVVAGILSIAESSSFDEGYVYRSLQHAPCETARNWLLIDAQTAVNQGGLTEKLAATLLRALASQEPNSAIEELMIASLAALPGARTIAARWLTQNPSIHARSALEQVLRDPSRGLVAAAVEALCAIGIEPSLETIQPLLHDDNKQALVIIRHLHGDRAAHLLWGLAHGGPVGLRAAAIDRLVRLEVRNLDTKLRLFLSDPNPNVRLAAFCGLQGLDALAEDERETWANDPVRWVSAESANDAG